MNSLKIGKIFWMVLLTFNNYQLIMYKDLHLDSDIFHLPSYISLGVCILQCTISLLYSTTIEEHPMKICCRIKKNSYIFFIDLNERMRHWNQGPWKTCFSSFQIRYVLENLHNLATYTQCLKIFLYGVMLKIT